MERAEGGKRVNKGEGGLDFDICPRVSKFLVIASDCNAIHHPKLFPLGHLLQLFTLQLLIDL